MSRYNKATNDESTQPGRNSKSSKGSCGQLKRPSHDLASFPARNESERSLRPGTERPGPEKRRDNDSQAKGESKNDAAACGPTGPSPIERETRFKSLAG